MMKKYFLMITALSLLSSLALSQKVGSTSMQFLKVMPTARGSALGDAYSVWAGGAEAVFWNPSGVISARNHEFSFSYVKWIFDSRQSAFSYVAPIENVGAIALQIQYVDFGEFIETSALRPFINKEIEPGITGNTFRPYSYLVGLTYAANLTDKFSTGVSVKYAHESLYNDNRIMAQVSQSADEEVKTWADGLIFDFGIRYNTGFRSIAIGAAVQNFGANVTYAKESHPIPMLFRWGIAGNVIGKDALLGYNEENRIAVAFDLFQPNDYAQQEHIGIEYEYAEFFALRAGYKINYDTEGFTFGGGIQQAIGMTKFSVDYAYGSMGTYLGNVHRISLGVRLQ